MKYLASALAAVLLLAAVVDNGFEAQTAEGLPPIAPYILNEPALSPDGQTLAFIYDGDIWTVPSDGGTARRLTVTVGDESHPVFSPDGQWIAFSSRRYGRGDIFVMPAEGGPARRLTFSDAWDYPSAWLPDSSGIIFHSFRREAGRDLWVVRMEGGEPWPITGGGFRQHELDPAISPDGTLIAYLDGGGNTHRRRSYNGTASSDIWICDFDGVTTSNHRRLTNGRSHQASPVFISNEEILYVTHANPDGSSDQRSRIAGIRTDGTPMEGWEDGPRLDPKQITVNGGRIAFSTGNYGGWKLHVGDLGSQPPAEITMPPIRINTDVRTASQRVDTLNQATEYAVSPDGRKIAFISGGDVFVMAAQDGSVPLRVTNSLTMMSGVTWANDSTRLIWVSTLEGNLYSSDLSTLDVGGVQVERPELEVEGSLAWPMVDPFGRVFAVVNESEIREVWRVGDESENAPESVPIQGHFHMTSVGSAGHNEYSITSDGRWLLLRQPNELYNNVVVLADTTTGELHQISFLFQTTLTARFSHDEKHVLFSNNEAGSHNIYKIDLVPDEKTFGEDKIEELFRSTERRRPERNNNEADENNEGDEEESVNDRPEVRIEFRGIRNRVERITTLSGNELWPVGLRDGKSVAFIGHAQGQANVWRLTMDPDSGPDLRQLTQSRTSKTHLTLSPDGRTLWWLDNGRITSMPAMSTGRTTHYTFSIRQVRDAEALRNAAFEEAVTVMGRYFYDESHHGLDWYGMAERYRPALESVRNESEYGAIMNDLLGELNSSHQGYTVNDSRSDGYSDRQGWLGVLFDPLELSRGRYLITEVLDNGPLDHPEDRPEPGTWLVGINGYEFTQSENLGRLLLETVGRKTVLHLNDVPEYEGAWELPVAPITRGAENSLWYERWVEQQRRMVDELSDGRLGYVHVPAMNAAAVREFRHHLGNAMLGKEGVVIDVRFNGGGSTAVDLLEILVKRPWLKRQAGALERISENILRSVAVERPSVLMINQQSFSNAEIMAEGFRELGIGPIIGIETAGGVIGTTSYSLMDGSRMRLPRIGAFALDGENLELVGRRPDIKVENHIEELDQGIDRQTRAAVQALLAQLDTASDD
jgi:tricorn protease